MLCLLYSYLILTLKPFLFLFDNIYFTYVNCGFVVGVIQAIYYKIVQFDNILCVWMLHIPNYHIPSQRNIVSVLGVIMKFSTWKWKKNTFQENMLIQSPLFDTFLDKVFFHQPLCEVHPMITRLASMFITNSLTLL